MEKNIIRITAPIDPNDYGEDTGTSSSGAEIVYDPAKIVHDPSADPRGPAYSKQELPSGPAVVALDPDQPIVHVAPREKQVRQLRQAPPALTPEDAALSAFVTSLGMDPQDVGLAAGPPPPASASPTAAVTQRPPSPATSAVDLLAHGRRDALTLLSSIPEGMELSIGGAGLGQDAVGLVMGIGVLIAQGFAINSGGSHYRITPLGREAFNREGHGA